MRRLRAATAALCILAMAGCGGPSARNGAPSGARVSRGSAGTPATDFAGATRDGKTVRISDYRGKTLLLNFFTPG